MLIGVIPPLGMAPAVKRNDLYNIISKTKIPRRTGVAHRRTVFLFFFFFLEKSMSSRHYRFAYETHGYDPETIRSAHTFNTI